MRNYYQQVYLGLVGVLINQKKVAEALSAAEQGRAKALRDLLGSNYGFRVNTGKETDNDILSFISAIIYSFYCN